MRSSPTPSRASKVSRSSRKGEARGPDLRQAQAGDNLTTIAEQFYKKVIGADPDKLGVDLTLKIPPARLSAG
jgi:hypothetical protein